MSTNRWYLRLAAVMCYAAGIATPAAAQKISDHFTRSSAGESVAVPFTISSASTTHTYGGAVEVIVSGTGTSYGGRVNDAFYGVPSGVPVDYYGMGSVFGIPYYQLNLGWDHGFALHGCDGERNNANNFITFIDGRGTVAPPVMPDYDAVNHTYDFVVTVPANAGHLSFAVSDCTFDDNTGAYDIQIFQLASGATRPSW